MLTSSLSLNGPTALRLNDGQQITVTSGVGTTIDLTPAASNLPEGVETYMLTVANDGTTLVKLFPEGVDDLTPKFSAHRVEANKVEPFGPFHVNDGNPRLWSSAACTCVINLEAVTGEA